ncbi:MAG: AMIN domain-containing protein [Acidobacteria bacterium]|nr:AMIN domain-containing protein [Acidobacteriota bacterium]
MTRSPTQHGGWLLPLVLSLGARGAETAQLKDVRHTTSGKVTRVAIELSGPAEVRRDRLSKPERYFFDFVKTTRDRKGLQTIQVGDPLVRQIRVAEAKPGVMRVVLDLESEADVTTSELENPFRLIVEVKPRGHTPPPAAKEPVVISAAPAKPVRRAFVPPKRPVMEQRAVVLPLPPAIAQLFVVKKAEVIPIPRTRWPKFNGASKPIVAATNPAPPPAEPAKRTAAGTNSLTRALGLKLRRVMIDPGHGGHDQGSSGPTGLLEKELVLDVSKRLGELIEENLGSEVVYTRDDDHFVPLEARTRMANESKADLFLSIHANSSTIRSVTGVETYYLSFTNSKEALEVASRENATSDRSVFELRDLLQKIAMQDKINESREFAAKVNNALYRVWGQAGATRNRGVKKAPFVVLIGANMPSVLAEIGFLSNPRDEQEMKKPATRQKIAEALYRGIAQYADSLSHFTVARRGNDE